MKSALGLLLLLAVVFFGMAQAAFPSEGYCDLQFYNLVTGARIILLDELPVKLVPIVRCIDTPQNMRNKAYLFEVAVGKGRLLVSGFNIAGARKQRDPAADYLSKCLIDHLRASPVPKISLPLDYLRARSAK